MTEEEQSLVAELREQGNNLWQALEAIRSMPTVDQRALAIAATHFQTAQMWLIRSIERPDHF